MPDAMSRDPEVVALAEAVKGAGWKGSPTFLQAEAKALLRALHSAGYRVVAAESDADAPDPNRTGMPKCSCGDIAYRPDPVAGRLQAWRCGGCHRTLSKCDCAAPTDVLDHVRSLVSKEWGWGDDTETFWAGRIIAIEQEARTLARTEVIAEAMALVHETPTERLAFRTVDEGLPTTYLSLDDVLAALSRLGERE